MIGCCPLLAIITREFTVFTHTSLLILNLCFPLFLFPLLGSGIGCFRFSLRSRWVLNIDVYVWILYFCIYFLHLLEIVVGNSGFLRRFAGLLSLRWVGYWFCLLCHLLLISHFFLLLFSCLFLLRFSLLSQLYFIDLFLFLYLLLNLLLLLF